MEARSQLRSSGTYLKSPGSRARYAGKHLMDAGTRLGLSGNVIGFVAVTDAGRADPYRVGEEADDREVEADGEKAEASHNDATPRRVVGREGQCQAISERGR